MITIGSNDDEKRDIVSLLVCVVNLAAGLELMPHFLLVSE